MDCKSRSIDRLISNNYISILIHKNQIGNTNLREVLRERIKPEVIRQYRIPDRAIRYQLLPISKSFISSSEDSHMPSNTLVESPLCKSDSSKSAQAHGKRSGLVKREGTNTLNAAARCCFRYSLSSSKLSNLGYDLIFNFLPSFVLPKLKLFALPAASSATSVAAGAILFRFQLSLTLKSRVLCEDADILWQDVR